MKQLKNIFESILADIDDTINKGDEALDLVKKEFDALQKMNKYRWSEDRYGNNYYYWDCPNFINIFLDVDPKYKAKYIVFSYIVFDNRVRIQTHICNEYCDAICDNLDVLPVNGRYFPTLDATETGVVANIKKTFKFNDIQKIASKIKDEFNLTKFANMI